MNGMNYKPYINRLLTSLDAEKLKELQDLVNVQKKDTIYRDLNSITDADKGVGLYTILLDIRLIATGYLIYNDQYCTLLGFSNTSGRVIIYELNLGEKTYRVVNEYLTVDYLRHEIDILNVGGGDPVDLTSYAKIHSYQEGTVLTDEILAEIKSGDILKVGGISLLVTNAPNLSPRAITSKRIAAYDKYWDLNWEYGEELELNLVDIGGSEPVVAYEGTVGLPEGVTIDNWALHRCIKNSNILWVTWVGGITRTTSEAVIQNNTVFFTCTLPPEIASHIYRQDGTNCSQAPSNTTRIIESMVYFAASNRVYVIDSPSANTIRLIAGGPWNFSTGASYPLDLRVPIFLDIGTNA